MMAAAVGSGATVWNVINSARAWSVMNAGAAYASVQKRQIATENAAVSLEPIAARQPAIARFFASRARRNRRSSCIRS